MSKQSTMEMNKLKSSGSIGLSYPMLAKENYTAWSMKMKVFMQAQGVWCAVEQTDPKAAVEEKTDKVALAMIYQGIPEEVLLSLAEKKTAKEAWEAIKTLYQGADRVKKARIQTLKSEFESLSMKESDQLDDFHMKLNALVTNIRALGEKMEESYVVKKLLRAVPQRFLQITSTMEQFGNLETMSIEEAIGSLKAHDERIRGKIEPKESQLMLTEEEWSKRDREDKKLLLTREEWLKRTNKGSQEGSSGYKNRGSRDKSKIKCYNCHIYGHFAAECRKPNRAKDQYQEVNMAVAEDNEPALLLAKHEKKESNPVQLDENRVTLSLLTKNETKVSETKLWYLDNGASNHMTGFRSKFTELDEKITGQVRFGDGSSVKIEGKGTVMFVCKNGEEFALHEVYYIPSLQTNIVSIGQLSEEGNRVVIKGEYLWVFDQQERLLMKVERSQNRLYKLMIETGSKKCLMSKQDEVSRLWHLRLGHVNYQALNLMSKHRMVNGMPRIAQPKTVCVGCLMSKQTRKQFPTKANYTAKMVLDLIHGDLCGPISPPTAGGNKYFFLLVDDYSRKMWVYFLKNKDEALNAFKKFLALVETGSERKVKVFRTDRGGEFSSNEFKNFCEEVGIKRHYTAPYTPQQNGVVERRNRTVVEMGRSCLKEMNMPSIMWGEAIRHSVYLLNRLPTRALSGKTPYEVWTGNKPHVGHIRVFGCLSHMKIPSCQTSKLDDRSRQVINLGKEPGTKAYRLLDPTENKILVSRDVTFEEEKAWPWNQSKGEANEQTPQFAVLESQESDGENQTSTEGTYATDNDMSQNLATPEARSQGLRLSSENYDDSTEPRHTRKLTDIYNDTEEVELDEELYLMGVEEPASFRQAVEDREWRKAMEKEIESIEKNNTWELSTLPTGQKVIGLKWIFKLKKDADGRIVKHKARLVAKGYVQEHGVDFEEIFAPVTRLETVRLLLALSAKNNWEVHHLDVKTAFLNGELKEDVYVAQPEGFEKVGKEHLVYKLIKALYGLRQAPRAWYAKLNSCLENLGFTKCPYEHAVYTRKEGGETLIIAVYVDDLLVTGSDKDLIEMFKEQMSSNFEMSNLGRLSYYLGIEVKQSEGYIELKQTGYARKILEKAGMNDCNPAKYPMDPKELLTKDEGGTAVDATQYKSLVGGLRYLVHTRPDIAYSVGVVSRFMERPTKLHVNAVKRILRYVKGTLQFGLTYSKQGGNNVLLGYSDSDLGGNLDDRKSTGGVVFYLNESLITWVSQKQRCVALSSCEAEFMAATSAACQGIWLRNVLAQITGESIGPVTLCIDNRSAIDLAKNPVFHGRSKHIDIRFHFIRECVERGEVILKHVPSHEQRADVLTKALTTIKFEKLRSLPGVENLTRQV